MNSFVKILSHGMVALMYVMITPVLLPGAQAQQQLATTYQTQWYYHDTPLCGTSWNTNQCSLNPSVWTATDASRDLNHDGIVDIVCPAQADQTKLTITNRSSSPLTLSCRKSQCNSCTTGNGKTALCNEVLDKTASHSIKEISVKSGCTVTCSIDAVSESCLPQPSQQKVKSASTYQYSPSTDTIPVTHSIENLINHIDTTTIEELVRNLVDDDSLPGIDELQTRFTTSKGHDTEMHYIENTLRQYGFTPIIQDVTRDSEALKSAYQCPRFAMHNIIATVPGREANHSYILMAHYDSSSIRSGHNDPAPGANDNASGVAALLSIARALSTYHETLNATIKFVFTDASQQGLCGSTYFANTIPPDEVVEGVFNLDTIGASENNTACALVGTKPLNNGDALQNLISSVALQYVPNLTIEGRQTSQNSSDHAPFWAQAVPSVLVTSCTKSSVTQSQYDTTNHVSGSQITKIAQAIGGAAIIAASQDIPDTVHTTTTQQSSAPDIAHVPQVNTGTPRSTDTPTPTPTIPVDLPPELTTLIEPITLDTSDAPSVESLIIGLINRTRADNGLDPLRYDAALGSMANSHARDLSNSDICGHKGSNGLNLQDRALASGILYSAIGETVACGQETPDEAVNGWWNSPPHHDILVGVGYHKIGVSWISNGNPANNRAVAIVTD